MKILVMGLPGSGKTYLSQKLHPLLDAAWYNADRVRSMANDWDFSEEGRLRQANRMSAFANFEKENKRFVVCDFVCPTEETRKAFNPDIIISHCPREIALTALSTLVFKYPIYGCIHSDLHPLHYKEQSFAWKILEYISFSFIKSCIGLNSDTIKNLPYLAKFRAQVIYNPVLPKDNNFSLPNYEKSKNIIAVGSLTKRKNQELIF